MQKLSPEQSRGGHPSRRKEMGGKQHGVWKELWAPERRVLGERQKEMNRQRGKEPGGVVRVGWSGVGTAG